MQRDLCFLSFFFPKFGYEPACNDLWTTHQFKRVELCGKVFFIRWTLKSALLQCPDVVIWFKCLNILTTVSMKARYLRSLLVGMPDLLDMAKIGCRSCSRCLMTSLQEYFCGLMNDIYPHASVLSFSDLQVFKIEGGPQEPWSALPIDKQPTADPTCVVPMSISHGCLLCKRSWTPALQVIWSVHVCQVSYSQGIIELQRPIIFCDVNGGIWMYSKKVCFITVWIQMAFQINYLLC